MAATFLRPPVLLLRLRRRPGLRLALGLLLALLLLTALAAWGLWQLAAGAGPLQLHLHGAELLAQHPGAWTEGEVSALAASAGVLTGLVLLVVVAVVAALALLGLPLLLLLLLLGGLALLALVVGAPLLAALLVLGLLLSPLLVLAGVVWLVLRALL